jgi:hypothetical protein
MNPDGDTGQNPKQHCPVRNRTNIWAKSHVVFEHSCNQKLRLRSYLPPYINFKTKLSWRYI